MSEKEKMNLGMTTIFKEKVNRQFSNLSIEKPSASQYIEHTYADYVELNALFLKEEVTIADISDRLQDVSDENILNTELEEVESSEIASLETEKNDVIEEKLISVFNICKERVILYEEDEYPFTLSENHIRLKKILSDKHRLYLFLLISSNLNYFKIIIPELTKDFELLSYYSLKSYLPEKAIVKSFGKNSTYNGNAKEKITMLSQEMKMVINDKKVSCIPNENTQERGLDIIAWVPFKDKIPNMMILLCQCACGKEWNKKQFDTIRFKEYFHFDKTPLHAMFIPYSIAKHQENKFHQHDEILSDHIFFDRKRIIEQLEDLDFISQLQSMQFVDKSINEKIVI